MLNIITGFGGNSQEVAFLNAQVTSILGTACDLLVDADAIAAYQRLRDFDATDATLFAQISVAPAELASCLQNCGAEYRAHAGSGVAQILVSSLSNADELRSTLARWREIAHGGRGNLRVLRVHDELREGISIFDTPSTGAFGLMRRLKNTFDPHGIFNPGCFVGGL